jgi:hypothetical protein
MAQNRGPFHPPAASALALRLFRSRKSREPMRRGLRLAQSDPEELLNRANLPVPIRVFPVRLVLSGPRRVGHV